ncbi:MAG: tautomerase family protein [Chlamydiales bacterium]|nr:tautomerase family protein [Chlamydiales bacterium]
MPSILIEVRKEYSVEDEIAIIDAVHDALLASFKTRPQDKNVRLVVHLPHRFSCALSNPDAFTHITIDCFKGRSNEAKAQLYRTIVEKLARFGIPKDHIEIIIREMDLVNFGIRGGQMASTVELGFKVDV